MNPIRLTVGEYTGDIEKRLEYTSSASVFEVFPDSFMKAYTNHKNFTEFCEAIHCDMKSQDDLNRLQDSHDFDSAIRSQSIFESWDAMIETAYNELINQK